MAHGRLARRDALAALGGAAAFPFLRAAAAQAQTGAARPRLALFVSGGWFPSWSYEGAGSSPSSFVLGPSLTPLQRWSDRIRVLRGLADRPAQERQNPQNAHEGIGKWLLHGDAPDSVDNKLGEQLSAGAPRRALAWAAYREKNYYRRYRGAAEGGETDPRRTYKNLFATIQDPAGPAAVLEQKRRDARLRAVEAVEQAAQRLGERLPGAHKRQILTYVDGLGSFRAGEAAPLVRPAACTVPNVMSVPPIGAYNEPRSNPTVYPNVVRAHVDSAAAAHICGLTNVTTVFFSMDDNFPDTTYDFVEGLTDAAPKMGDHGISHDARSDNEAGRRKTLAQRWFISEIAQFAKQLEAVPSGGKTLLDQTLIVYVQAFGNSAHGRLGHMALVMGDPMSGLRPTARYINFDNQRTMADLWATVDALLTGNQAAFGPYSKGPLMDVLR